MGKPSDRILNQVYKTSPKLKNKHLFKTKLHATGTDCKNGNTVRTQPSRVQCHLFDGFIFPSCKADSAKVFSCDLFTLESQSNHFSKRVETSPGKSQESPCRRILLFRSCKRYFSREWRPSTSGVSDSLVKAWDDKSTQYACHVTRICWGNGMEKETWTWVALVLAKITRKQTSERKKKIEYLMV